MAGSVLAVSWRGARAGFSLLGLVVNRFDGDHFRRVQVPQICLGDFPIVIYAGKPGIRQPLCDLISRHGAALLARPVLDQRGHVDADAEAAVHNASHKSAIVRAGE